MRKKIMYTIAILIWILTSGVWIASVIIPNLEITKETVENACLIYTTSGLVYGLVYVLLFKKAQIPVLIIIITSAILLSIIIELTDWTGDWKTQTVLYEHGHLKRKTIEFQMQDKGAFGFNRRIVEVTRINRIMEFVVPVDTSGMSLPWIRVNKKNNEIGFNGG